jgi:hypothetical protein
MDSFGFGYRPVVGCCENENELSGSIKASAYLDWLNANYILKKNSTV